ncbi:MAG: hypothetical protein ABJL99_22190 [Aliishimia sp.]
MLILSDKLQVFASVGFIYSLAAIGLSAHLLMDKPIGEQSMIDGSLQSLYEAGFTHANPLNDTAISAMAAMKYAAFGQAHKGAIVGKDGWLFTSEEFEVDPNFYENMSNSATEIARVRALMKRKGVKLIPVIIPDKADVHADKLKTNRPVEAEMRHGHLLSLLASRNVPVLDAKNVLSSNSAWGQGFLKDDTHWSPEGSRAVAEMVASHLAQFDIGLTQTSVTTVQGSPVNFNGDLLQFVPTGVLRETFGPAQNKISTYTTTVNTGSGLFGGTNIDVALVGTSFSAKAEWNFLGFLQDALGADALNFATEGQGPFAPMHDFIASDTFQNTPPKLVVWEIPTRYTSLEMTR